MSNRRPHISTEVEDLRMLYEEDDLGDDDMEYIHTELWGWEPGSDDEEEQPATPPTPPGAALPTDDEGHYDSDHGSATDVESDSDEWWDTGVDSRSNEEIESDRDSVDGEVHHGGDEEQENNGAEQGSGEGDIRIGHWNTRRNEEIDALEYIAGDLEGGFSSGYHDWYPSDESEDEEEDGYLSEEEEDEYWDEEEEDQDWDEGFVYDDVSKEDEEEEETVDAEDDYISEEEGEDAEWDEAEEDEDWDEGFEYDDVPKEGDEEEVEDEGMTPTHNRKR